MKINLKSFIHSATFWLGVSSAFCFLLLMLRIYATLQLHFAFLVWNLFLAWVPFWLAVQLHKEQVRNSRWKPWVFFSFWLLFFPNAPYILTDLFHLKRTPDAPFWFDMVLILSFAWTGLMLGFVSLMEVHDSLEKRVKPCISWAVIIGCLFLCGFGIYLGRFERWNSWDLITNPLPLLKDVLDRLIHPAKHPRTIGITMLFAVFLSMQYLILRFMLQRRVKPVENK